MNTGSGTDGGGRREVISAADLFEVLWEELVGILGTAAAATLVRRAVKRARARSPDIADLQIDRDGWEYRYRLPPSWKQKLPAEAPGLPDLVRSELVPLLRQFTGPIVIQHLCQNPALRDLCREAPEN